MVLTNGEVVDPPTVARGFADLDLAARPGAGPDVVDAGPDVAAAPAHFSFSTGALNVAVNW
jgi:hypothetical protein